MKPMLRVEVGVKTTVMDSDPVLKNLTFNVAISVKHVSSQTNYTVERYYCTVGRDP